MFAFLNRLVAIVGGVCGAILGLDQYAVKVLPEGTDTGFSIECRMAPGQSKDRFFLAHRHGEGKLNGWLWLRVNGIAASTPVIVEIDEGPPGLKLKGPELTCYLDHDGWLKIAQLRTGSTATADPCFEWPAGCKVQLSAPTIPLKLEDVTDWEVHLGKGGKNDSRYFAKVRDWRNLLLLLLAIAAPFATIEVVKFAQSDVNAAAAMAAWVRSAHGNNWAESRRIRKYLQRVVLDNQDRNQVLNDLRVMAPNERASLRAKAQNHLEAHVNQMLTDLANQLQRA